jgi:hypothetical protein
VVQMTRRQVLGILLASIALPSAQVPVVGQETPPAPLKVLFIGNSYTSVNDLPAMVAGLTEAAGGRRIEVDRHLVGGCTLEKHVKDQKAIDKIRAAKWDVVVLQEHSLRPVIDRQAMHEYWWGEGDWMIWSDEDGWPPSYHGTGSEEYFNSGWCQFDRKAVSGFVMLRPGHPTVYSFHLNDAFQFQRNIRVAEEQMGYGPGEKVIRERHPLWGSTAYWYASPAQPAASD